MCHCIYQTIGMVFGFVAASLVEVEHVYSVATGLVAVGSEDFEVIDVESVATGPVAFGSTVVEFVEVGPTAVEPVAFGNIHVDSQ